MEKPAALMSLHHKHKHPISPTEQGKSGQDEEGSLATCQVLREDNQAQVVKMQSEPGSPQAAQTRLAWESMSSADQASPGVYELGVHKQHRPG